MFHTVRQHQQAENQLREKESVEIIKYLMIPDYLAYTGFKVFILS